MGNIIIKSQSIMQMADNERIGNLVSYSTQKRYFFLKLFNDEPWKEVGHNKMVYELSPKLRFFIVATPNKN
jgi:hypothetical protein